MNNRNDRVFAAWLRIGALGAAIFLVVSINILWLRLDREATNQADWVDHSHQVIATLEEALAKSDDMASGQRGFALTHEKDFMQPYIAATNRMPELVRLLRKLTQDNPAQQQRLKQLEALLAKHEAINREHIEELVTSDPLAPDLDFRRAVRESMDAIRATVGQMTAEENRLLSGRRDALKLFKQRVTLANIASGLVSIGLMAGVFNALWRENARRRKIEMELQQSHEGLENLVRQRTASLNMSEERLRLAQQVARIGTFELNIRTGISTWTPELEAMHGLPPGGFSQTHPAPEKLVHPDDRAMASARIQQALETGAPGEGEWRVVWPDGSVHWLFGRFQVFNDESGKPLTLIGVNIDVTERKRLEREILDASDSEMRRIGHDLHDGVGQQLTALSLFITSQQNHVPPQTPQFGEAFRKILSELREIIRQIRLLSHGLSPVSLEDNGLAEALRKLADDTCSVAKANCEFEDSTANAAIDPLKAAQLFRIGQEAVANALKHAHAKKIRIALETTPTGLELRVSDDGCGFPAASPKAGLGLRAMKYRADLIGAMLQIDSAPGKGTQIICSIHKQN